MFKRKPIRSIGEYLNRIDLLEAQWGDKNIFPWKLWFRGEPNRLSPTRLRPKLYRSKLPRKNTRHQEQELRLEFRRHAVSLMEPNRQTGGWRTGNGIFLCNIMEYLQGCWTGPMGRLSGSTLRYLTALNQTGAVMLRYMFPDPYWLNELAFEDLRLGSSRPVGIAFPDSAAWSEISVYLPEDPFDRDRLKPELPLAITPSPCIRALCRAEEPIHYLWKR